MGIGTDKARVSTSDQINLVLDKVNYEDVVLNEADKSVYLKCKGVIIDFGGIAKGHGGDEAAAIVREHGIIVQSVSWVVILLLPGSARTDLSGGLLSKTQ